MPAKYRLPKNIVVAVVLIVSVLLLAFLAYFLISSLDNSSENDDKSQGVIEYEQVQEQLAITQEQINQAIEIQARERESELQQLIEATNSIEDLASLPNDQQGVVGINKVVVLMESGDNDAARPFIDYLMLRSDNYGLNASVYCYRIAATEESKDVCTQRANEQALEQGIIEPGTELPLEYFEDSGVEIG